MVRVPVNRVLGTIHALLRCYTVYIIGTTHVFGCSGVVCSLAGTVFHVVLPATLKTGTTSKNHISNSYLHLEIVKNNLPAYLYAIPDAFLLPSESFTLITFKSNFTGEQMAMSPSPGQVAKRQCFKSESNCNTLSRCPDHALNSRRR